MFHIRAITFDLFDTLVTMHRLDPREALGRLMRSLQDQGVAVDNEAFLPVYREAARQYVAEARRNGRETHNRFWVSAALCRLGYDLSPDDRRIAQAVEAYFSAFLDYADLLPDTRETMEILKRHYRLGLLSNFTHGPAAREMLARLGLTPFLEVTLISGELGYRKPHRSVFRELQRRFGLPPNHIAFVGDDLEADINGARQAGLQPIWMTYAWACKATAAARAASPPAGMSPPVPTIASWGELLTLLGIA
jgi:putative hydrolase of the HAD superfamily